MPGVLPAPRYLASGEATAIGAAGGQGVVAILSDAELADLPLGAVLTGDRMQVRAVAAEAVSRYAGIEPGRAVAGMYYLYLAPRELDLDALLERLLASADAAGPSEMDRRLAGDGYRARMDAVRTEAEAEIRRDRGSNRPPRGRADLAAVARHIDRGTIAVRLDGHSDYGMVLRPSGTSGARRPGREPA